MMWREECAETCCARFHWMRLRRRWKEAASFWLPGSGFWLMATSCQLSVLSIQPFRLFGTSHIRTGDARNQVGSSRRRQDAAELRLCAQRVTAFHGNEQRGCRLRADLLRA